MKIKLKLQAFTLYEEAVPDSKSEVAALHSIIGALHACRIFDEDSRGGGTTPCAVILRGAQRSCPSQQSTAMPPLSAAGLRLMHRVNTQLGLRPLRLMAPHDRSAQSFCCHQLSWASFVPGRCSGAQGHRLLGQAAEAGGPVPRGARLRAPVLAARGRRSRHSCSVRGEETCVFRSSCA